MNPFRKFTVEFDDERLGTYRVEVKPSPVPPPLLTEAHTWGRVLDVQETQRQFIEDAIQEKLEREGA